MTRIIHGRRDLAIGSRMKRPIDAEFVRVDNTPENQFRLIASTDVNYDWGYYREKLMHGLDNVDMAGAVSVLFNHDRNQVIGRIVSCSVDGHRMNADVEIDPDVTGSNGLKLLNAIKKKYIRGVSIGYDYSIEDCVITEDRMGNRDVTVNKWQLSEITITPTPADLHAHVVRQRSDWAIEAFAKARKGDVDMNFSAWLLARGRDESKLSVADASLLKRTYEAEQKIPAPAPTPQDELKVEREKRELAERERGVAIQDLAKSKHREAMNEIANSHGIEGWKPDMADGKSEAQCLRAMMEMKAKQDETNLREGAGVNITRDAADKADEAAEDALGDALGLKNENNRGMRGGSVLDIGRRWLAARGEQNVLAVGRREIAEMLMGNGQRTPRWMRQAGRRDAANVTSGMFTSYLLANVMDKVIYNGFMASEEAITYPIWCDDREVMDFKSFTGAALDAGNLVETAENTAFPELAKAEGGYNATLGLWGATISLTLQAMQNDDLGEFMRWLRMAGFIARRTVDVKVYTDLAAATWTSRTTTGDLTDDTLSVNRSSLAGIAGPAGQVLGMTPRYLIVPAGLRKAALGITQLAPALIMNDSIKVNTDLLPVITPFLPTAATATQSTWYIAAAKMYSPVIVATLQGVKAPIIEEYDPGAVAARKWKCMFPFKVVIPTVSSKIQAMWQGTH